MPRLMSVMLTTAAVRERRKTVTRRLGWKRIVKAGDRLTLCEKVQGRRNGEPLIRICDVEVLSVRRERLDAVTYGDVEREGFAGMSPVEFVDFFCEHMRCDPATEVTRIEWRYLDGEVLPEVVDCPGRQGWWGLPSDVEATVRNLLYGAAA